jgi:hypothetical protein
LSEDANVFEKHTVSVFRAEMEMLGSGGIYIGLEEGKTDGVGQSGTERLPLLSIATSALKMETVCFSEMLAFTGSTRC